MLTVSGSTSRLERLRSVMQKHRLDVSVITNPKNVYYFSAFLAPWTEKAILVVCADQAILVCGTEPAVSAATSVRTYEANAIGTLRLDQNNQIAAAIKELLSKTKRVGTEFAFCDLLLRESIQGDAVDLGPDIYQLRRRKDPDELELIYKSAACIDACYDYARNSIEPGLTEVELYGQLLQVAIQEAGEPIGRFGNDFQCGTPGGPPRNRPAEKGEIWILDLAVEYRGYAADASRCFVVDKTVTDTQQAAWNCLVETLHYTENAARPGGSCKAHFKEVKHMLDSHLPGGFTHHLGHGFGLFAHETPHLNPHWDETFEIGDTFTVEPGLYHHSLSGGLRLENDYLMTSDGLQRITQAPLEMI